MRPGRLTRAFALLVLILAQAALSLPQRAAAQGAMAHGMATAGRAHEGGMAGMADGGGMPSHAPGQACGCCHGSMPGTPGGCPVMAVCGPTLAAPVAPALAVLTTVATTDLVPAISSPAAHDFIPDPPPPRA